MNDITVTNGNGLCKSNHYSIKFKVNLKVDRKKATKIKAFNFKRANWDLLNRDITTYDIDISIDTNEEYIDFSTERIKQLLNDIYVNKACGPDNIPGIVLKHCSSSISAPLSQLFHSIYDTGIVPNEWKKS